MTASIALFALIIIAVTGVAVALWLQLHEKSRRDAVERALGASATAEVRRAVRKGLPDDRDSLRARMLRSAPSVWSNSHSTKDRLTQAGFEGPLPPLIYSMIRLVTLVSFPLITLLFIEQTFTKVVVGVVSALIVGLLLPPFVLLRLIERRRNQVRRSLPDALDLLVVCVEAGISLDAAILRVARDLTHVHPEFARELLIVSRKTNAGMPREDALRGLWERTGVDEVRALVASLVQSERWGSSSARVLKVSAEALRRKRRHAVEKKAATAPLKMVIPMALLIFPALFVVVLGPAIIEILKAFSSE